MEIREAIQSGEKKVEVHYITGETLIFSNIHSNFINKDKVQLHSDDSIKEIPSANILFIQWS